MSSNYVHELEKDKVVQVTRNCKNNETTTSDSPVVQEFPITEKAGDGVNTLDRQHTWIERMANRKSIAELIHGPNLSRRDSVVVYGKTFLIDNNLRWRIRYGQRISLVFSFLVSFLYSP